MIHSVPHYPIHLLTKDSPYFPQNLLILKDCPDVLYIIGNEKILNQPSLAIVGTRNSSELGNNLSYRFAKAIAMQNIPIVSGFAKGIDLSAHLGASYTSKTIVIVPYGFETLLKPTNTQTILQILENGGVFISEYFPDTPAHNYTFVKRNRLIACLAEATLVIEAPQKSGALITAQYAQTFGKKLFSLPWDITNKQGIGNNLLIQKGATLVTSPSDILSFYSIDTPKWNNEKLDEVVKEAIKSHKKENMPAIKTSGNSKNRKLITKQPKTEQLTIPKEWQELYTFIVTNQPIDKETILAQYTKESISTINTQLTLLEINNYIQLKDTKYKIVSPP